MPAELPAVGHGGRLPGGPARHGASTRSSASAHTTSWRYQGGKYVNDNSYAAEGDQFVPDTVLVLRVRQSDAGYLDPAGNRVPETVYYRQGRGAAVPRGRGRARHLDQEGPRRRRCRLRTAAGPLKVPAGHVWIELVPTDKDGGRVDVRK